MDGSLGNTENMQSGTILRFRIGLLCLILLALLWYFKQILMNNDPYMFCLIPGCLLISNPKSNRVPLLIAVPGASGKHSDGLVELVDLFPTVNIKANPHTQTNKQEHTQTNKFTHTLGKKHTFGILDCRSCWIFTPAHLLRVFQVKEKKWLTTINWQFSIEKHPNIEIYPIDIWIITDQGWAPLLWG